ncbi:MAG: twin-arginine translocase TatA/TatE family subunit [bacterium]|nr:twin-arginine translocase TatA/TatE family subunit [bacterium]
MLPQGAEWIIVLVIALLVFGPKNLPKIGRALGSSIKEFKDSMKGLGDAEENEKVKSEKSDAVKKDDVNQLSG